jgi:glycosyltransferase involved in cell wall biosynthesis
MSVGIPVIASKVPSYIGSPALLCENPADWYTNLDLLLSNRDKREMLTREGILYCRENYSKLPITEKYASFFDNILRPDAN